MLTNNWSLSYYIYVVLIVLYVLMQLQIYVLYNCMGHKSLMQSGTIKITTMITFLCVFDDGNVVQIQKTMTLAQAKIWVMNQVQKYSHLLRVEIREDNIKSFDHRNLLFSKKSFK